MTTFQFFSLLIPVIVASIASVANYLLSKKAKRTDLYYQNAIPAFKEMAEQLTALKNYGCGKADFINGNEFSPFYTEQQEALMHRTQIAQTLSRNSIYFSIENRELIEGIINTLSGICNYELHNSSNQRMYGISSAYTNLSNTTSEIIEKLYKDLKLTL